MSLKPVAGGWLEEILASAKTEVSGERTWNSCGHTSLGVCLKCYVDRGQELAKVRGENAALTRELEAARAERDKHQREYATCKNGVLVMEQKILAANADRDAALADAAQAKAEVERLRGDKAVLDWLELRLVEVREPLVYGSRRLFFAYPVREDDGEDDTPSDLRVQVLAALTPTGEAK